MSILNFTAGQTQNQPFAGMPDVRANGKPKSKIWMNPGYVANGKTITTPFGLGIDTMEKNKQRGSNEEFNKIMQAGNELLDFIQAVGDSLEPGQEIDLIEYIEQLREAGHKVPKLTFMLRKVSEPVEIAKEDNEYGFSFGALPKPAVATAG